MLRNIGTIPAATIGELSGGRFEMEVSVEINKTIYDYDQAMILGPVFPHEVVGFSGGNKYPSRHQWPRRAKFFPLARRGDQSDDHRQQVDTRA